MAVINQILTLEQAIAREDPTWDVIVGGFGRFGTRVVYPELLVESLPSISAVAIGPRSQIDRCWVLWDPQVVVNPQVKTPQIDYVRRLTREAPLLFPQLGKKNIVPGSTLLADNTSLRFLASPFIASAASHVDDLSGVNTPSTFFPATFDIASQAAIEFEPLPGPSGSNTNEPFLHLVFYLRPPDHTPPKDRMPYTMFGNLPEDLVGPGGSPVAEIPVFQGGLPVYGRRQINLIFSVPAFSGLTYDVRIGGIVADAGGFGNREITLDATTAVNISSTNPKRVQIDNPGVDWITIWTTKNTGGAGENTAYWNAFVLD